MFLGPWACGSECCSSNPNAPDTSQKGLIGIQSHHSKEKMSKKAREKPAEAGSASVSPYGSVPSYELVTSQPNRLINLIWPECRTWFIGPWLQQKLAVGTRFHNLLKRVRDKDPAGNKADTRCHLPIILVFFVAGSCCPQYLQVSRTQSVATIAP